MMTGQMEPARYPLRRRIDPTALTLLRILIAVAIAATSLIAQSPTVQFTNLTRPAVPFSNRRPLQNLGRRRAKSANQRQNHFHGSNRL
jgi:hypothetical protein